MGAGVMVHPAEEKHAAGRGVCGGQRAVMPRPSEAPALIQSGQSLISLDPKQGLHGGGDEGKPTSPAHAGVARCFGDGRGKHAAS